MALPYLPAEKIERRFQRLQQLATVRHLQDFCSYIHENWIRSQTFPPQTWSVFLEAVRTTNDLEGWHNGLNRCAKGRLQLPLYIFIQLLHREGTLVNMQICLVSDRKLKRHQRLTYRTIIIIIIIFIEGIQLAKHGLQRRLRCREDSSTSGSNTRMAKGIQKNFWRPVLISFNQCEF